MKHINLFLLFALILAVASCKKTTNNKYVIKGDYFIVGHTGGFTTQTTAEPYYLVNNGEFRKDMTETIATIPDDVSKFNFHYRMDPSSYGSVADLPYSIPSELLSQNNANIGGYIADVGYTDVRASINGATYRWYIQGNQANSSAQVQAFVTRLQQEFQ